MPNACDHAVDEAYPCPPAEDADFAAYAKDLYPDDLKGPLRVSAWRRQARWLYAASRQVLFGTPRTIVASACVVLAVGLLAAGGTAVISQLPTSQGAATAARALAPDKMVALAVPAQHRTKISLSVPEALPAPIETIEPQAADALPPDDSPENHPRVDDGVPQMPPIAPAGAPDQALTKLISFKTAPFPYNGLQPGGHPFLDVNQGGRKGHRTWYGLTLWQDQAFNDDHVLVHVPSAFDPSRPGVIVVFFHGYGATLTRDILARQKVPQQITDSGANAVLLAPQFAVDARDSSSGRFWEPGAFSRFLDEAAESMATLRGDASLKRNFAKMPVVIVAYSGGFLPAAWALRDGAASSRVRGLVLLDAVYGELDQFAAWAAGNRSGFLVSAFTRYTQYLNNELGRRLAVRGIGSKTKLDGNLSRGSAVFLATGPDVHHADFVTQAWTANPIQDVLSRLPDINLRDPQTVASIDH